MKTLICTGVLLTLCLQGAAWAAEYKPFADCEEIQDRKGEFLMVGGPQLKLRIEQDPQTKQLWIVASRDSCFSHEELGRELANSSSVRPLFGAGWVEIRSKSVQLNMPVNPNGDTDQARAKVRWDYTNENGEKVTEYRNYRFQCTVSDAETMMKAR